MKDHAGKSNEWKSDDDPFLLRYLPGTDAYHGYLRSEIQKLNSDANQRLVQFVAIVGPTGSGKNHFARVFAGHQRWLATKRSPEV
jgi:polynucleotide 5'-kinase involved in rRNA processing